MLKILQARLQQYINHELPDVQAGFRKSRGTRDQIANICWIMEKAKVSCRDQEGRRGSEEAVPGPSAILKKTQNKKIILSVRTKFMNILEQTRGKIPL